MWFYRIDNESIISFGHKHPTWWYIIGCLGGVLSMVEQWVWRKEKVGPGSSQRLACCLSHINKEGHFDLVSQTGCKISCDQHWKTHISGTQHWVDFHWEWRGQIAEIRSPSWKLILKKNTQSVPWWKIKFVHCNCQWNSHPWHLQC